MGKDITIKSQFDIYNDNTFNRLIKLSESYAKSGLTPFSLKNKPNDIFIILQMGAEMNMLPRQAMAAIDCIQGRPTLKPSAMRGMISVAFPNSHVKIDKETELEVVITMGRDRNYKDDWYTSRWTIERALKLGLTSKDNWKKQQMTMLKWRAMGDAARTVFPDVIMGMYSADEVDELDNPHERHDELVAKIEAKKDDIELNEKILKKETEGLEIGEFIISIGSLDGKKLKDVDAKELLDLYINAQKHFESGKVPMSQKEDTLLTVLEIYLKEKKLIDN